jgi:hypothetical protein
MDRIEIVMKQYYGTIVCSWNTVISTSLDQIVYHQKDRYILDTLDTLDTLKLSQVHIYIATLCSYVNMNLTQF